MTCKRCDNEIIPDQSYIVASDCMRIRVCELCAEIARVYRFEHARDALIVGKIAYILKYD